MKILIVDDHAIVRAGTRLLLKDVEESVDFYEAGYGQDAIQIATDEDVDVVILDLSLPDINGFDVLTRLHRERPCLPVILVSMHNEKRYIIKAYATGAAGYLSKENAPEDLVNAVRKVMQGGKYICERYIDALVEGLAESTDQEAAEKNHGLSPREQQIAELLVAGHTNKEIAWQLDISAKTVSTYKTRILDKLHLKNVTSLVRHVLES